MNKKYFKGSEWIKCDLHLHTPDTKLNAQGYELTEGEDKWEEYCDLIDANKKELVWQGMGTGYLAKNMDKKIERIKEFVAKIMEKYPPGVQQ